MHTDCCSKTRTFLIIILPVLLLLAGSCTGPTRENDQPEPPKQGANPATAIRLKPPSSFNDTLVIGERAAVFYHPDSLQMERIGIVNEPGVLKNIVHDCHYQMEYARDVLRKHWSKIKVVEVYKFRYLLFIKADKSRLCIDLNGKNDICGIFLFDRKKDPVLVDMPNIDTALGFYFKE